MYEVNDTVMYGKNGVCKIVGFEKRVLSGQTKEYYVLQPVFKKDLKLMAPVGKEESLGFQKILTKEQIHELVLQMPTEEPWIEDSRQRRESFDEVLSSGNRTRLIAMIRTIFKRQTYLESIGKQLASRDLISFRDAQKRLHDEFALVLGILPEQVPEYIQGVLAEKD